MTCIVDVCIIATRATVPIDDKIAIFSSYEKMSAISEERFRLVSRATNDAVSAIIHFFSGSP